MEGLGRTPGKESDLNGQGCPSPLCHHQSLQGPSRLVTISSDPVSRRCPGGLGMEAGDLGEDSPACTRSCGPRHSPRQRRAVRVRAVVLPLMVPRAQQDRCTGCDEVQAPCNMSRVPLCSLRGRGTAPSRASLCSPGGMGLRRQQAVGSFGPDLSLTRPTHSASTSCQTQIQRMTLVPEHEGRGGRAGGEPAQFLFQL